MKKTLLAFVVLLVSGCAVAPLSKQAVRFQPSLYENSEEQGAATIRSSGEKKYESKNGMPKVGDLAVCTENGIKATSDGKKNISFIRVPPDKKITLTSIIQWNNTGWEGTCWPFVSFVPEKSGEYVVVNEVIGGKGIAGLWTGIAFQSCEVSVYKIENNSFRKVLTEKAESSTCAKK